MEYIFCWKLFSIGKYIYICIQIINKYKTKQNIKRKE